MDPSSNPAPWDAFPLILCINLKEREDRYREAIEEFHRAGLRSITFYRTTRQKDRNKGCIDSHMACLQRAVDLDVPYALIFEDDVQFLDHYQENIPHVTGFLRSNPHWNLFYLGGFIFRKIERASPHILRGGVLCTQAYVVRTAFAKEILKHRAFFRNRLVSIDLFYSMLVWNNAFVHDSPLICSQRASESDGTWDSRNLSKAGWLGKAMIYSSLDREGRRKTDIFPRTEKMKVENGLKFFVLYRPFLYCLQHVLNSADKLLGRTPTLAPAPPGEFIPSDISQAGKAANQIKMD